MAAAGANRRLQDRAVMTAKFSFHPLTVEPDAFRAWKKDCQIRWNVQGVSYHAAAQQHVVPAAVRVEASLSLDVT